MKKFRCPKCGREIEAIIKRKAKCKECKEVMIEVVEEIEETKPVIYSPFKQNQNESWHPVLSAGDIDEEDSEFQTFLINGKKVKAKRSKDTNMKNAIKGAILRGYQ